MRSEQSDPEVTWTGTAVSGVTVGALLSIWSGLALVYLMRHPPEHSLWFYLDVGLLLTGLAFFGGGLSLGLIRRHTEHEAEQVEARAT